MAPSLRFSTSRFTWIDAFENGPGCPSGDPDDAQGAAPHGLFEVVDMRREA